MANEKRLIDANEVKERIWYGNSDPSGLRQYASGFIDNAPTVDAVPRGVVDQIRWERDVAIKQLEEHGIPFCGIAPDVVKVVRCKDCKNRGEAVICPMCWEETIEWDDDGYTEIDFVTHDYTTDNGFCHMGERREGE